jgi:hypothetical protein
MTFRSLVMTPLTTMCPVREAADQRAMARGTAGCAGPPPAPVRSDEAVDLIEIQRRQFQ